MTALLGLILVTGAAGFAALMVWCSSTVAQIPGHRDPLGDLIVAWWLAVAWVCYWLGIRV